MMHGDEAKSYMISSLLDEVDMKEHRSQGQQKDTQKAITLHDEIIELFSLPNFATMICQIFESGSRQKILQHENRLPDEMSLGNVSKFLKLSPSQSIALAFALMHSQYRALVRDATSILKLKLMEVSSLADLPSDMIHSIVYFISTCEDDLCPPELIKKIQQIAQRDSNRSDGSKVSQRPVASSIKSNVCVSKALNDFGYQCSANSTSFRRALYTDIGVCPLDESHVADLLMMCIPRQNSLAGTAGSSTTAAESSLLYSLLHDSSTAGAGAGAGAGNSQQLQWWNTDTVCTVIADDCPQLNWGNVLRCIDQAANLFIPSEAEFNLIAKLHVRMSSRPLQMVGLMSLWENRLVQLALLSHASKAPCNLVDFSGQFNSNCRLVTGVGEQEVDIPSPANLSWMCPPLHSILLSIASRGNSNEIIQLFMDASHRYPEYVLLGLAQVNEQVSGVRTEILRQILVKFSGLSGSRPSSDIVMSKLNEVNQDLLVLLCRIGLKNAQNVQEISKIERRMKSYGSVGIRIQEECSIDEILGYWCFIADNGSLNLDERLMAVLNKNPPFARNIVLFAKLHLEKLRPRNAHEGGLLSYENIAIILKCAQQYPNVVSTQDIRTLATMANQHQQQNAAIHHQRMQQQQQQLAQGQAELNSPRVPGASGPGPSSQARAGGKPSTPESEEIEAVANSYFQKIYTSDMTIAEVIQLLKRFKSSNDPREQEIFRSMIHNLFDEYRFFHKYPEKALQVTGRLFGTLIQHQLVSNITLGIALRYVLEALRKDPEQGGSNEKMFRFGQISLEQFRSRLNEWPQYCSHLVQIQHLPKHCYELFSEAQKATSNTPNTPVGGAEGAGTGGVGMGMGGSVEVVNKSESVAQLTQGLEDVSISAPLIKTPQLLETVPAPKSNPVEDEIMNRPRRNIDEMYLVNNSSSEVEPAQPPENTRDQILFIVNNIAKSNVDQKTGELKGILGETYYSWFANYLIVKRVSTQPNLHSTYLTVIDLLDDKNLLNAILNSGYQSITSLLQSANITTSATERSLLRNLGMWLGQLTLARNKPILQRRCDLKELVLWGYESGRLIAVCSFVAKTIEGCRDSIVFRPPNPWLMALLGVLRELYEIEDLKMNIKFEVQVLCKNIGVKIEDVPKSDLISKSALPIKERSPDFNNRGVGVNSASPSLLQSSSPSLQASQTPTLASSSPLISQHLDGNGAGMTDFTLSAGVAGGVHAGEQIVIPNLASHVVINPSLSILSSNFSLRRLIPIAVDRAIREIIQPVVERSVTIACVTTKQMILKDFVAESNENHFRRSSHLMVSNLAGSLALVTCKEPLRISICNHIRTLFSSANLEHQTLEQIIQVCSSENLDLGCMLIERAATEKAIRDIDEALASAIQVRRKHREGSTGGVFVDTAAVSKSLSKYSKDLPDVMKAALGGLLQSQVLVYEAFKRQRSGANAMLPAGSLVVSNPLRQASPVTLSGQAGQVPNLPPLPPSNNGQPSTILSMAQALEAFQHALSRVDLALKAVMVQAQGRDVSLSMLGADHEILARLREVIHITQCTQPAARLESAMTFAESVFKRLVETVSVNDTLRLEVMVGIMEALRDACGGSRKFAPDMISWLSHYATFNVGDEGNRKLHRDILTLLLRAKLLRPQEVDVYFAGNLDSGRNMLWVEIALGFIRHSLAEGLAATYQFSKVFDIVSKMRPANATIRKQLQKWLSDIRTLAANREEQKNAGTAAAGGVQTQGPPGNQQRDAVREHVMVLLDRWLRVWNSSNDQVFGQYLQVLHQYGVLKTEEAADRFFRLATEICVEACVKSATSTAVTDGSLTKEEGQTTIQYTVVDALSKLFLLLVRLADKEASDVSVRINLLNRILNSIARSLHEDHENKKHQQQQQPNMTQLFDQRPYFRLFSNLMLDLGPADSKQDPNPSMLPLLQTYYQIYLALQPSKIPGFAFAWLQLVSHKSFMPHLLLARGQKGWPYMHRLLLALLHFMQPFLRTVQMIDPIRQLYKGTLKVLLVLLHDFPEFLCDYHLSFCEAIPHPCVQLRNLVLSAFPRSMRLPDPFTPNLKIDLLPEISQPPRVLTDFVGILNERGIRQRLDAYLSQPGSNKAEFMHYLLTTLSPPGGQLNTVLATSVVMFVATHGIAQQQQQQQQQGSKPSLQLSVALDVFQHLVEELNPEGRYHVLNVMVNQLRYPNNQTHYFSCVLLTLFQESTNELLQEQITRVLLERLIVHRPHPWGLLITFIELIKNPVYSFWRRSFTHCAPEIERVFESVARSCIGTSPAGSVSGANDSSNSGGDGLGA